MQCSDSKLKKLITILKLPEGERSKVQNIRVQHDHLLYRIIQDKEGHTLLWEVPSSM